MVSSFTNRSRPSNTTASASPILRQGALANSNQKGKKREASPDESQRLEFSSNKVKALSDSRINKTRLPDQVSSNWKQRQDARNHARMFLSYFLEGEKTASSNVNLSITNTVDDQPCPPWDVAFTDGYKLTGDTLPSDLSKLEGCGCDKDECDPRTCACFKKHTFLAPHTWKGNREIRQDFAYDNNGRLRDDVLQFIGAPIWECNSKCGCSDECRNRVVQKGRTVGLDIYKDPLCGWGLRAGLSQLIPKGTFIINYWGELLSEEEAERRGVVYDQVNSTYLLNLDHYHIKEYLRNQPYQRHLEKKYRRIITEKERHSKNFEDKAEEWLASQGKEMKEYTVDAALWGNCARFIQHSCDPNMNIYPVYLDEPDIARPVHAFFANRDIQQGEPLSFSYYNNGVESSDEEDDNDDEDEEDSDEEIDDGASSSSRFRPPSHSSSSVGGGSGINKKAKKKLNAMLAEAGPGPQQVTSGGVMAMQCLCRSANCKGTVFKKS